jgi:hypothetical protein
VRARAELAGWLATQTEEPDLRGALWLRQAELTHDGVLAAELLWQLDQSGRLDDARFAWASRIWNRAGHASRVIQASERLLRAGRPLPRGVSEQLAAAYRAEARPTDARRAATEDPRPAPVRANLAPRTGGFF